MKNQKSFQAVVNATGHLSFFFFYPQKVADGLDSAEGLGKPEPAIDSFLGVLSEIRFTPTWLWNKIFAT